MKREIQSKAKSTPRSPLKAMPAAASSDAADPVHQVEIVNATLLATPTQRIDREQLIAEAAYHHAEARGFEPGHDVEDWLAAEAEVDARLCSEGCVY